MNDFRPSMSDEDPVTGRLYRDKWALRRTTFRPSLHLDYEKIGRRTDEDPSANATAAEIAALIAALEAHYRELGEKLKPLKRAYPLARMPNESETAYRKRVPGANPHSPEWQEMYRLARDRTATGRMVKALRDGHQPHRPPALIKRDPTTCALLRPFEERWNAVYRAARGVEEARVRAIIEATPINDEAWEEYQLRCDWSDARKEVDAAWSAECAANGGRPPPYLSASDIFDILQKRAAPRAAEITRARHAAGQMTEDEARIALAQQPSRDRCEAEGAP